MKGMTQKTKRSIKKGIQVEKKKRLKNQRKKDIKNIFKKEKDRKNRERERYKELPMSSQIKTGHEQIERDTEKEIRRQRKRKKESKKRCYGKEDGMYEELPVSPEIKNDRIRSTMSYLTP